MITQLLIAQYTSVGMILDLFKKQFQTEAEALKTIQNGILHSIQRYHEIINGTNLINSELSCFEFFLITFRLTP